MTHHHTRLLQIVAAKLKERYPMGTQELKHKLSKQQKAAANTAADLEIAQRALEEATDTAEQRALEERIRELDTKLARQLRRANATASLIDFIHRAP